jgi:hypothetical protein
MRSHTALFLGLVLFVLTGGAAWGTDLPVEGGPGGDPVRDDCSGDYAVGLYFRSGRWVDAIGLRCSSFDPQSGTFKMPPRDKPYHGGPGGALGVEGICPNNTYFSGITHGYTREGTENKFLNFVEMTCTPVAGGDPVRVCLETGKGCWVAGRRAGPDIQIGSGDVEIGPGIPWLTPLKQHCPPGEAVVGINVRRGLFVDALGLICGPSPKPLPVVETGKRKGPIMAPEPPPPVGGAGPASPPPTPPPQPPAEKTVTVALDVEVYDQPGGNGKVIGDLIAGTQGVFLAEPCRADHWCHVKGNVPNGEGWVWSGPGYEALKV